MNFLGFLAVPLGYIMKACYALVHNYGLALLIFTIFTRVITLPLQIKQQKGTARMSLVQPELEKIKKKYANNKEKLNEETMNIYSKHGVNPMASCLPMLVTMVILFSMIPVIYGPLTYVSNLNKEEIKENNSLISNLSIMSTEIKEKDTNIKSMLDKFTQENVEDVYDEFIKTVTDKEKYPKTTKAIDTDSEKKAIIEAIKKHDDIDIFMTNAEFISQNLAQSNPELVTFDFVSKDKMNGKYADILSDNIRKEAEEFKYEIFGLKLGAIPNTKSALIVIPILSFILQLATTIVSQIFMKKNNPAAAEMGGMMKGMLFFMPFFSLYIGFRYPAGLGLYWIYSSLLALLQTVYLNVVYTPEHVKELVEKDMEKEKKKKKKPSFMERALEMQKNQNGTVSKTNNDEEIDNENDSDDFDEDRKLSKSEIKELQRKKLNEARKRMAEKYGDEYTDSDE